MLRSKRAYLFYSHTIITLSITSCKSPSPQFAGWGMILSVPIPITFKKTPSGGRSQLSSGSPRYSKITATCRGEKYWQPTRYPCFFNSSHKGMQRLIQSIRWRRAVALLVASGKKSKPNSVLLYIRFDIFISKLHLRMMILEKAIQGLGYIGTGSDLFMLHFTFVQVIILADKPVVQLA